MNERSSPDSGLYVLLLHLALPAEIRIGRLGRQNLPAGWYAYTGSARRALQARVHRHFAEGKKVRWHVDYLTVHSTARVLGAAVFLESELTECALNRRMRFDLDLDIPIVGFGATDCREGCGAHLCYRPRPIDPAKLVATGRRGGGGHAAFVANPGVPPARRNMGADGWVPVA